ncbi:hypothetical protein CKAN_00643600 [Cinnamomum micranthum f. kanehirae]|uniref:Uncharacterized protein n=1 Tax=Cinnamomum micranthum f. kanehirae TaxID=337451 RepID=A0A443NHC8_9MAGN|nr:hypothetical protein CKAN_00643600 [Cinnamomum micranthum f. kanehirae]
MDVPEKLLQFKFHFIFLTLFSTLVASIVTYSSSVVTVFSYFWPLVVSISLFFVVVIHDLNAGDLADSQRGEGEDLAASGGDTEDFGGGGKEVEAEVEEGAVEESGVGELAGEPRAGSVELGGSEREAAEVGFAGGSREWGEGATKAVGRASLSF